jgi:putative flippase GtrA
MYNLAKKISSHKMVRFFFSGGMGAFTQIFFLYFFTEIVGLWYLISAIIAFCISVVVSFSLQKSLTFNHETSRKAHTQIVLYCMNALMNVCINTLILYFLVDILHAYYLLAQLISSLLIAGLSFFVYKRFIFI